MLPEFITINDGIKISVSFHLLCYQLCCSHVLKMVAVVSGQCSWEEGAAGRGHPSKWFESPSQWEKVFISFPVVFFSIYGWELCYSSIPKLIHDESNGTSIHTLAKKDSVSWIKFFFPGGLWPHGVGWILKNKTKHTSKWKKILKSWLDWGGNKEWYIWWWRQATARSCSFWSAPSLHLAGFTKPSVWFFF